MLKQTKINGITLIHLPILYTSNSAWFKHRGLWGSQINIQAPEDAYVWKASTSCQQVPLTPQWPDLNVLGTNHLSNNSSTSQVPGVLELDELTPLSSSLLASMENIPNHLCNLGALTFGNGRLSGNHTLPHDSFLYLTHLPPTSPARAGDTLLVFLITAIAI